MLTHFWNENEEAIFNLEPVPFDILGEGLGAPLDQSLNFTHNDVHVQIYLEREIEWATCLFLDYHIWIRSQDTLDSSFNIIGKMQLATDIEGPNKEGYWHVSGNFYALDEWLFEWKLLEEPVRHAS